MTDTHCQDSSRNNDQHRLSGEFKKQWPTQKKVKLASCSHGRVVKASDKKSDGVFLRKFESCWATVSAHQYPTHLTIRKSETMKWGNFLRKGNKVIGQFKKQWPTPTKLEILKRSHGGVLRACEQKSDGSVHLKCESSDFEYFRSTLLNLSTYRKLPNNGIYVTSEKVNFKQQLNNQWLIQIKVKALSWWKLCDAVMAERLRRLTRSHMGSSCASSNLADCDTFRSPVLNTSNHQTVRNNEMEVTHWERARKITGEFKKEWPTPIKLEILKCSHCGVVRTSDKKSDTVFLQKFEFLWLPELASTQHINPTEGPK